MPTQPPLPGMPEPVVAREPYYVDESLTLHHGDVLEVLADLEPGSVDAVVTSPPYAEQRASTYGGIPEREYPAWSVEVFAGLERVLSPRGSVLWNVTPHVRGGMLSDYVLRTRLALRAAGWFEHDEVVWSKPNALPTGRPSWPVRAWESVLWYSRTPDPWVDAKRNGSPITAEHRRRAAMRAQPSFTGREYRLEGWDHLGSGSGKMGARSRGRNVVTVAVGNVADDDTRDLDHPAPFPARLAQWCVRLVTPTGGVVLDPFIGSGTTALAALREGARCVGIDRDTDYLDMTRARLARPHQLMLAPWDEPPLEAEPPEFEDVPLW